MSTRLEEDLACQIWGLIQEVTRLRFALEDIDAVAVENVGSAKKMQAIAHNALEREAALAMRREQQ